MNRYQKSNTIKEIYRNSLPATKPEWPPNIRGAFSFIIAHLFDEKLTVAWVKEQCGINSKSFAGRFCSYVHWYPKEYILHHRIKVARQLLNQTEVAVTNVAFAVGFNSVSSFSNSFKAREGLTPSQWREQN